MEQCEQALLPLRVHLAGIIIESRREHPANAYSCIEVMLLCRVTRSRFGHLEKVPAGMFLMELGILALRML